jgi:hypothetical protein
MTPEDSEFLSAYLAQLLDNLERADPSESPLKSCAGVHYRQLNMDQVIAPHRGDLPAFFDHLRQAWGWQISYDAPQGVILVDENKDHCVCPLVRLGVVKDSRLLCACSEGFAERLFAGVLGRPVRASVVRSVLRGDASCVYRIDTTFSG